MMTEEQLLDWFEEWLDDYYDDLSVEDDLTPEIAVDVISILKAQLNQTGYWTTIKG